MIGVNTMQAGQGNVNRAVQAVVATLGIIFGLGGMGHGFFEALQGNTPTGGLVIDAIGVAHRMGCMVMSLLSLIPTLLYRGRHAGGAAL